MWRYTAEDICTKAIGNTRVTSALVSSLCIVKDGLESNTTSIIFVSDLTPRWLSALSCVLVADVWVFSVPTSQPWTVNTSANLVFPLELLWKVEVSGSTHGCVSCFFTPPAVISKTQPQNNLTMRLPTCLNRPNLDFPSLITTKTTYNNALRCRTLNLRP